MIASEMAPPRAAIRRASHCGTLPPCSGKSALPERLIDALYKGYARSGRLGCDGDPTEKWNRRELIEPRLPAAAHVSYPSVSKSNSGPVDSASGAAKQALPPCCCV